MLAEQIWSDDPAAAVTFLKRIKDCLESPTRMLLEI